MGVTLIGVDQVGMELTDETQMGIEQVAVELTNMAVIGMVQNISDDKDTGHPE